MKTIHIISLCYTDPAVIRSGFSQFVKTFHPFNHADRYAIKFWVVDHCWPAISRFDMRGEICKIMDETFGGALLCPDSNYGGTDGYNWAIDQIYNRDELLPDDLIVTYCPDSFPVTPGWLSSMVDVIEADEKACTVSLWHTAWTPSVKRLDPRDSVGVVAGHNVVHFSHAEMMTLTIWRAHFTRPKIEALSKYYGSVEVPMHEKAKRLGFRDVYLRDVYAGLNPVPHPQAYNDWKLAHVSGRFAGNFDEYLRK
jgi:hypothetical protein